MDSSTIKILNADCLQLLPRFPSASVDLVLADLPYGQTQNEWDKIIPINSMFAELHRVAKDTAAIILMAAQPFASKLITSNEKYFRHDLIWRKNKPTGFLNANRQPLRIHEHILIFYKKAPVYHPQKTNGHAPGNYAKRIVESSNYGKQRATEYGGSTERYPTSVIDTPIINNDDPDKFHPTQKPIALMEWLIQTYTNENALVLDISAGVGTTGIAALKTNRRAALIEINPEYCKIAKQRLDNAVLDRP